MQMSAPGWLLLIACATLLAGAAFVAGSPFKNQSPLDVEASASKLYSKLYVSPEYSKLADIVLGTPLASFHNATLQVYKKILEDHGHTVQTVTNVRHPDMYPYFTGANGKTPYIDMVVSSDLPNNHAPWLKDYKGTYEVMGTCYELLQIFLAAPAYTGITSLTELKASTAANKTIIGFDLDPCARCPDLAAQWIREDLGAGTLLSLCSRFTATVSLRPRFTAFVLSLCFTCQGGHTCPSTKQISQPSSPAGLLLKRSLSQPGGPRRTGMRSSLP